MSVLPSQVLKLLLLPLFLVLLLSTPLTAQFLLSKLSNLPRSSLLLLVLTTNVKKPPLKLLHSPLKPLLKVPLLNTSPTVQLLLVLKVLKKNLPRSSLLLLVPTTSVSLLPSQLSRPLSLLLLQVVKLLSTLLTAQNLLLKLLNLPRSSLKLFVAKTNVTKPPLKLLHLLLLVLLLVKPKLPSTLLTAQLLLLQVKLLLPKLLLLKVPSTFQKLLKLPLKVLLTKPLFTRPFLKLLKVLLKLLKLQLVQPLLPLLLLLVPLLLLVQKPVLSPLTKVPLPSTVLLS